MKTPQSQLGTFLSAKFPTCIQQINYPVHNGKPNPVHGHFFFVGSVPAPCCDPETHRSNKYPTVEGAIAAAKSAGVTKLQLPDCSWHNC